MIWEKLNGNQDHLPHDISGWTQIIVGAARTETIVLTANL